MARDERIAFGFLAGLFVGVILLFIAVHLAEPGDDESAVGFFSNVYGLVAVAGAVFGFLRCGRAAPSHERSFCIWISVGLFIWAIGQATWMILAFSGVSTPYPSLADIAYLTALACWSIGIALFFRAIQRNPMEIIVKLGSILVFFWTVTAAGIYFLHKSQLEDSSASPALLDVVLDVAYLWFSEFHLVLLLGIVLDSDIKLDRRLFISLVAIIAGVAIDFVADLAFSAASHLEPNDPLAYYNGGYIDWLYAVGMLMWSLSVLLIPLDCRSEASPGVTVAVPASDAPSPATPQDG